MNLIKLKNNTAKDDKYSRDELRKHLSLLLNNLNLPGEENVDDLFLLLICIKRQADCNRLDKKFSQHFNELVHQFDINEMDHSYKQMSGLIDEFISVSPFQQYQKFSKLIHLSTYHKLIFASIISYFKAIDLSLKAFGDKEIGKVYGELIEMVLASKGNNYTTPAFINKIIARIINVKKAGSIYDPAVGTGGLFVALKTMDENSEVLGRLRYYGQECDPYIYNLLVLNMMINNIDVKHLFYSDSLLEPLLSANKIKTFDYIISDLPWSIVSSKYKNLYGSDRYARFNYGIPANSNYAFIQHILAALNSKGKAVLLMMPGILSGGGKDSKIRKKLIEDDLIEAIIQLPSNIYKKTGIRPIILILNKNKNKLFRKRIFFASLSDQNKPEKEFDSILRLYVKCKEEENRTAVISLQEIRKNDYNLFIGKYLGIYKNLSKLAPTKVKKLRDLVSIGGGNLRLMKGLIKENIPFIGIKDIKAEITNMYLDIENVDKRKLTQDYKYGGATIRNECLLVSKLSKTLKPVIFSPKDKSDYYSIPGPNPILYSKNIIPLIPNGNLIDIEYLYYQLYSTQVQEQIKLFQGGSSVNRLSLNDLMNIYIPYVPLNEQKAKIEEKKLALYELEELRHKEKLQELNLRKGALVTENSIISTLSHNLLPQITSTVLAFNQLVHFLENKNIINEYLEDDFDDFEKLELSNEETDSNETLKDLTTRIENYLIRLENVVTNSRKVGQLSLSDEDFQYYNLKVVLDEIVAIKLNDSRGKYKITYNCPEDIDVRINKLSFEEALLNIISNAELHAFNKDDESKNIISFDVYESWLDLGDFTEDVVVIIYRNNGKLFDLTEEEFFEFGKKGKLSQGDGIGGYYIKKVIDLHDGKIEIIPVSSGMKMQIILPGDSEGGAREGTIK